MVALAVIYSSTPRVSAGGCYASSEVLLTLRRPGHLLIGRVYTGHRGGYLEPYCPRTIPARNGSTGRDLGEIVLCRARVIDLLRGDVVDGGASGNRHDIG
jgi:hypothetical protein